MIIIPSISNYKDKEKLLVNKDKNKLIPNIEEDKIIRIASPQNNNNINNDYYKTVSTFMSINKDFKEDMIRDSTQRNNTNFSSNENDPFNFEIDYKKIDKKAKTANGFYNRNNLEIKKKIISRNNLIARQNQFLLSKREGGRLTPHSVQRTYYANLLANQEQTIINNAKNKLKLKNFYKMLSTKSNKSKEKLLMNNVNIDTFRMKK